MARSFRLTVRTQDFHSCNTGSIPVGTTKVEVYEASTFFCSNFSCDFKKVFGTHKNLTISLCRSDAHRHHERRQREKYFKPDFDFQEDQRQRIYDRGVYGSVITCPSILRATPGNTVVRGDRLARILIIRQDIVEIARRIRIKTLDSMS